jgi:3-hydroxybutyryl-CoA dehydrogenase
MTIRTVTVLGAGTMGHGIAHVAALAGYETGLFDPAESALAAARDRVDAILSKAVDLGKATAPDADRARARLTTGTDVAVALAGTDFVVEAAPERMDLKLDLFAAVERHAPPAAVVTTNTSALSVTEMAGSLADPARVAGMHFFNPVHKMKLVEIVRALESSAATIEAVEAVATRRSTCSWRAWRRHATSTRRSSSGSTTRWGPSSWSTWSASTRG